MVLRLKIIAFFYALSAFQFAFSISPADEALIKGIIHEYVDAWNEQEGRGFADHFALDSDFINIFGMQFRGREAIEQRHRDILQSFLKGSTFKITSLELRDVNPNAALAFVKWQVDGFHPPGRDVNEPGETIQGIFCHVLSKNHDNWEIIATQNTLSK